MLFSPKLSNLAFQLAERISRFIFAKRKTRATVYIGLKKNVIPLTSIILSSLFTSDFPGLLS